MGDSISGITIHVYNICFYDLCNDCVDSRTYDKWNVWSKYFNRERDQPGDVDYIVVGSDYTAVSYNVSLVRYKAWKIKWQIYKVWECVPI